MAGNKGTLTPPKTNMSPDAEREEAELRSAAKKTTRLDTLLLGACCMFANNSQGMHSLLLALLLFLPFAVSG